MTNLMRWLMYLGLFLVPYLSICLRFVETSFTNRHFLEFQLLPIIAVILFGVSQWCFMKFFNNRCFFQLYSIYAVLSGVMSVKDCPEASKELSEQIQEARKDLISKGFKFRD
ncbi:DPM3 family protein [Megaselia abdita]